MKKSFVLLAIFMFAVACGNSDKKKNSSRNDIEMSPCDLLTEAEVKSTLSIPAETITTMSEKHTTYPICLYKWESITWPVKSFGDHIIDYPAEMSIVLLTNANKEMYETSIEFYENGQAEKGVGDMATWSDKKTQITFLSKGMLIHVSSKTSADAASNKTKTIKVAKLIVDKL